MRIDLQCLRCPLLGIAMTTLILIAGCASPAAQTVAVAPSGPTIVADNPQWQAHLQRYIDSDLAANPAFAAAQGRHQYDGQLPDWSADGIARNIARLHLAREETTAFAEATLSAHQRFERHYLLAVIDGELFWLEDARIPFHNPAYYIDGGLDPSLYLSRPYAPLEQRMRAFIAYARAIPQAAAQIRANLETPMPKTFIDLGIDSFSGYAEFYRQQVAPVFAPVRNPQQQTELKSALSKAAKAMQQLAGWLKQQRATASDDYALGPERFARMLAATEAVGTPLATLEAAGKADLARNLAALEEACAQYRPGAGLHACVARVNADKPQGGPVQGARAQLDALHQFIVDQHLVTIPDGEQALVAEAPPYARGNAAYIDIPGPYDRGMPSTYYIAPPDPKWSKSDREAYLPGKTYLLFTSAHEVWPGHFLQFLHAKRAAFEFGQLYIGYAYAEGWAHYSEELMWEAGLGDQAPAVHIGQLSNALLRDVRFLCAIGLHTQHMHVKTCETMFREQAFQDPGNARQQAARGTYDPAYLNYTLGKLMIRKLRADWTASRGGRAAWHDFHDQFLSYGGPPIPLVREQMLGSSDDGLF